MKLPHNLTEKEFLETLDKIIYHLGHTPFGTHDMADLQQQAYLFACQAVHHWDGQRPLENFLRVHIRNRLINFKRDELMLIQSPCLKCPMYDPLYKISDNQCGAFANKEHCSLYARWINRANSKQNVLNPIDIEGVEVPEQKEPDIDIKDLEAMIDMELPITLRADYLKMRADIKIPEARQQKVKAAVLEIIQKYRKEHNAAS